MTDKQSFGFDAPAADMERWKSDAKREGFRSFGEYIRSVLNDATPDGRVAGVGERRARRVLDTPEPVKKPLKCSHPRHGIKGWKCPGCRQMF